ncbi:immunity protein TriTu family protein [Variovorax sp. 54]|uniref:immunity protein TriTu family protein n=1 Tax=Variovorax sp. 54 TaxID=2035212 RepID=UPI0011804F0D|nr:hypothetical protein [Variovorax sp. 54]
MDWAQTVQTDRARGAKNIDTRLTESEPSANPSARLDVDVPTAIGRITVWESGDYDIESIDLETERSLYADRGTLQQDDEMSKKFSPFFASLGVIVSRERLHARGALIEALWLRLHTTLSTLAEKIAMSDSSVIRDVGRTSNGTFLLRAYLAFRRSVDGEELAITVDIRGDDKQMAIESDICKEDGTVLMTGPPAEILWTEGVQPALDDWVREFEQFLSKSEAEIVAAVSRLS